jgi:hypothetical protein
MVLATQPAIMRQSVQEFPNAKKGEGEVGFWSMTTTNGPLLYAWATRMRERQLRDFERNPYNWMGQSAVSGLVKKVAATPKEVSGKRNVNAFTDVLRYAHFGAGWDFLIGATVRDFTRQDGGAWWEIIAPGNPMRPPTGKVTGVALLDSLRVFPTGDPEYPAIYYSRKGKKHLMHRARVAHFVDMPDGDENNPGYGLCALSRAMAIVTQQFNMNRYVESKLDDRPAPGFVVASGITEGMKNTAFDAYRAHQGTDTRPEEGKIVWFFSLDPSQQIKLEHTTFAQAPEGYSYKEYTELHANAWALALGVDIQELWQLTGGSLGSGSQSQILHAKSQGKMYGNLLMQFERVINEFVLPDYLKFEFKRRDAQEEQERATTAQSWSGFVSSAAATLSIDEQRRLLADLVEPYRDVVTDAEGKVVRLNDTDDPVDNEQVIDDTDTAAKPAPTETQEAPAVRADAKAIADTRADFEREFNSLLSEARGDETNRRSFSIRLRNVLRIYGEKAYSDGLVDAGGDAALSAADRITYVRMLAAQSAYVSSFSATLFTDGIGDGLAGRKADLWYTNSISPFYYAGIESADGSTLMQWHLGIAEHCEDCPRLHGQVHTMKEWRLHNLYPGSGETECTLACQCSLTPTKNAKRGTYLL